MSGIRLWGPLSPLVLAIAALMFGLDQTVKWWMLNVLGLVEGVPVRLAPFFDLALNWNTGVSYSLFRTHAQGLLIAISLAASVLMWAWGAATANRLTAFALGLIIGGALGNALDRAVFGAVVDFFFFHAGGFNWYVFNPADVGIVAGGALLLYQAYFGKPAAGH